VEGGGQAKSENGDDGEAERAHIALDDEVSVEFEENVAEEGPGAQRQGVGVRPRKTGHVYRCCMDGGGNGALVIW
jgi:hypothetical protein